MTPGDAAVAVRSFPRRWRALFARIAGDEDPGDVLRRHGSSSPSALALAQRTVEVLAVTDERLGRIQREDSPALSGDPPPATPGEPEEVLDSLDRVADELARTVEGIDASQWRRPAALGGETTDALGVLTAGVEAAAANLRQADDVLEEVRR